MSFINGMEKPNSAKDECWKATAAHHELLRTRYTKKIKPTNIMKKKSEIYLNFFFSFLTKDAWTIRAAVKRPL